MVKFYTIQQPPLTTTVDFIYNWLKNNPDKDVYGEHVDYKNSIRIWALTDMIVQPPIKLPPSIFKKDKSFSDCFKPWFILHHRYKDGDACWADEVDDLKEYLLSEYITKDPAAVAALQNIVKKLKTL